MVEVEEVAVEEEEVEEVVVEDQEGRQWYHCFHQMPWC
jgi:hypothetical protein